MSFINKYQEHIESLAAQMGVILDQEPGMPGMMFVEEEPPRIEISTITDVAYYRNDWLVYPAERQTKYFAALHELGHCHYGHTQGRPPFTNKRFYFENGVLKSEAQAWDFAFVNCLDEVKDETRQWALKCFNTYRQSAILAGKRLITLNNGNRHHVAFQYDDPYGKEVLEILSVFKGQKEPIQLALC